MRLLKNEGQLLKIPDLGFRDSVRHRFMRTVDKPYGMFLVTGPTGSGKSFTLFSVLDYLNDPNINICTVEDPVEYRLPGLAQVQTNPKAGVTFASALRSFLRQDPDVIMVGEIRDQETAKIATEAALTGHLVLATLHTNGAAGAVTRLVEMGVEPFNLTASLLGVLGQRLVRRVCRVCGTPTEPNPDALERLGIEPPAEHSYRAGPGCDACNNSGYRGRTAVHELLVHTPEIESAIMGGVSTDQIARIATDQGMDTLRADATRKAFDGVTTLDEVLRVTDA
jgi:type IV pilus assembly protein PilB